MARNFMKDPPDARAGGRAGRPRHWRTVFSIQPRSRAILASGSPAAAAITILARSTSRRGIVPTLMISRSFRSRLMVIRTGTAGGPGIRLSAPVMLASRKDSASRARREGKRERRPPGERRPDHPTLSQDQSWSLGLTGVLGFLRRLTSSGNPPVFPIDNLSPPGTGRRKSAAAKVLPLPRRVPHTRMKTLLTGLAVTAVIA